MKNFFTWRDEWALGVEIIDHQHQQLALVLNKIVELYLNNGRQADSEQRSNQLREQLNILYEQTREHFNDEEELMLKENYPGHPNHAREHLMLLAELKHYIRDLELERDNINMGTLNSLKTWFISHIISSDKEFTDFLHAHSQKHIPHSLTTQASFSHHGVIHDRLHRKHHKLLYIKQYRVHIK